MSSVRMKMCCQKPFNSAHSVLIISYFSPFVKFFILRFAIGR